MTPWKPLDLVAAMLRNALTASYSLNQNEVALFNLGPCCLALGRTDEARKYLTEFVRVGTHQPTAVNAQTIL